MTGGEGRGGGVLYVRMRRQRGSHHRLSISHIHNGICGAILIHSESVQGNPNMIMALAGNKADLSEARAVTKEEAQTYADENSLVFWETSAKANLNVTDVFQSIAEKLPKATSANAQPQQGNIQLNAQPERPKRAGCCG